MITEKFIKQNEKITGSNNYFSHRAKLKNSNTPKKKGGGGTRKLLLCHLPLLLASTMFKANNKC